MLLFCRNLITFSFLVLFGSTESVLLRWSNVCVLGEWGGVEGRKMLVPYLCGATRRSRNIYARSINAQRVDNDVWFSWGHILAQTASLEQLVVIYSWFWVIFILHHFVIFVMRGRERKTERLTLANCFAIFISEGGELAQRRSVQGKIYIAHPIPTGERGRWGREIGIAISYIEYTCTQVRCILNHYNNRKTGIKRIWSTSKKHARQDVYVQTQNYTPTKYRIQNTKIQNS